MTNTTIAAAARRAALAAVLGATAAAAVLGFSATANAATGTPTANPAGKMYGNPAAAAPYWARQHTGDCALMAIADVVGQITGHEPTEQEIIAQAEHTTRPGLNGPIYPIHNGATDEGGMPVLLAHYGVHAAPWTATSISGLEQDLGNGDKVIVTLNAETIWNYPGDRTKVDHAVVVTGIDTNAGVVHLNDSGVPQGRDEQVSLATFEQAWATGVTTDKSGFGGVLVASPNK